MNPAAFIRRWTALLPEGAHAAFLLETAALITVEQARERRRLCTDEAEYRRARLQTAGELAAARAEQPR